MNEQILEHRIVPPTAKVIECESDTSYPTDRHKVNGTSTNGKATGSGHRPALLPAAHASRVSDNSARSTCKEALTNLSPGKDLDFAKIVIYGGGKYGTVVGSLFAAKGYDVTIAVTSGRDDVTQEELQAKADDINLKYAYFNGGLNHQGEPKGSLRALTDHRQAFEGRGIVVFAAPSTGVHEFCERLTPAPGTKVVSVAKGFCFDGWSPDPSRPEELMHGPPKEEDVRVSTPLRAMRRRWTIQEGIKDLEYAVVAGPGFADDMEQGKASGLVVASSSKSLRRQMFQRLANNGDEGGLHPRTTLVQTTSDTLGLEIAAGYKNLTAIAAGMALALANPHMSEPAIKVTPEMQPDEILKAVEALRAIDVVKSFDFTSRDIVKSMGKKEASALARGITGHGVQIDEGAQSKHRTLLTMISADFDISSLPSSRNCEFGVRLVEAYRESLRSDDTPSFSPAKVLREYGKTVEGIPGAFAAKLLGDSLENETGIDLPVVNAVVDVLRGEESPHAVINALLKQQRREQIALDLNPQHLPGDTHHPKVWPPRIPASSLNNQDVMAEHQIH